MWWLQASPSPAWTLNSYVPHASPAFILVGCSLLEEPPWMVHSLLRKNERVRCGCQERFLSQKQLGSCLRQDVWKVPYKTLLSIPKSASYASRDASRALLKLKTVCLSTQQRSSWLILDTLTSVSLCLSWKAWHGEVFSTVSVGELPQKLQLLWPLQFPDR